MESTKSHPTKTERLNPLTYLVCILLCLLLFVAAQSPQINKAQEERVATTIKLLQELAPGDFVELQNGQIFITPDTPQVNAHFYITLARACTAPEQHGVASLATQTKRIITTGDLDWPNYARSFLLPKEQ